MSLQCISTGQGAYKIRGTLPQESIKPFLGRVYDKKTVGSDIFLTPIHRNQSKQARIKIVMHPGYVPKELYLSRRLSAEEKAKLDWNFLDDKSTRVFMNWEGAKDQKFTVPHAAYLSPKDNEEYWPILRRMQEIGLEDGFREKMMSYQANPKQHKKKRKYAFDDAIRIEPGHQEGGIRFANSFRDPQNVDECFMRDSTVQMGIQMVRKMFDQFLSTQHQIEFAVSAPVTVGGSCQSMFSNVQINASHIGIDLQKQFGAKGGLHFDKMDDSATLSVIFFLGNYPEGIYPGLFAVFSSKCSVEGDTFGAAIVCARHPHGSIVQPGKFAADYDSRIHASPFAQLPYPQPSYSLPSGRLVLISYGRMEPGNPE